MRTISTHKASYVKPNEFEGWKYPIGSVVKVRRLKTNLRPHKVKDVDDPKLDLVLAKVIKFNQETVSVKTIENETYSVPYNTVQRTKYTKSPKFKSLMQIDAYVKKIIDKYRTVEIYGETYTIDNRYRILYDITRPAEDNVVLGSCDNLMHTLIFCVPALQIMDKFDVKDTVLHEVGHALTADLEKEMHGQLWFNVTRAIGGTGKETNTVFGLHRDVVRNEALWDKLKDDHETLEVALPKLEYDKMYRKIQNIIEKDLTTVRLKGQNYQQWAYKLAKMLLTLSHYSIDVIKHNREHLLLIKEGTTALREIVTFYAKDAKLRKSDPRVKRVSEIRRELTEILQN